MYALTVRVAGGPHAGGGFDLLVSAGTLSVGGPNVQTFSATEAGHSSSAATEWQVKWTAPASGDATFWLAVNSVNRDGTENGDAWNTQTFHSALSASGATEAAAGGGLPAVFVLALVPVVALAVLAGLAWWRPAIAVPAAPARPPLRRAFPHLAAFAVALIVAAALTLPAGDGGMGGGAPGAGSPAPEPQQFELSGFSAAGASSAENVTLDFAGPAQIEAVLTWTDEADQSRHQNQPDTLEVTVTFGDKVATADGTNPQGGAGEATAVLDLGSAPPGGITDVNVSVACSQAGAQYGVPRGLGLRDRADTGNAWTVELRVNYTAASAAAGRAPGQSGPSLAHDDAFDAHADIVALGATLFAAALGSALVLRGVLPAKAVPARLRPTKNRHAIVGVAALIVLGAGAALGAASALAGGHAFEPHGILGLILLAGFSAQAVAGYLALRGRPTRRLHGLIGSAMAGALLGVAAAGLVFFLA